MYFWVFNSEKNYPSIVFSIPLCSYPPFFPLLTPPITPPQWITDPFVDAIEVMVLCLTHRDGDWEPQLERATHKALLYSSTMDFLALLRSHGWDDYHFQRMRDPDALVEHLEAVIKTHANGWPLRKIERMG